MKRDTGKIPLLDKYFFMIRHKGTRTDRVFFTVRIFVDQIDIESLKSVFRIF